MENIYNLVTAIGAKLEALNSFVSEKVLLFASRSGESVQSRLRQNAWAGEKMVYFPVQKKLWISATSSAIDSLRCSI